MKACGTVYLVGAGPGDPSLITMRGMQLLKRADVVIYDRLAPVALLSMCSTDAIKIDVGKTSDSGGDGQSAINSMLVEHAKRGMNVVRLKGGDPGVFGRAAEERAACLENGVPCVIVPGVSSCIAAPASIGLSVTQRGISRSFMVLTARGSDGSGAEDLDFSKLSGVETLIVMMGRKGLATICSGLIDAGSDPNLPVACVERATTRNQRQCSGNLETIASKAERLDLRAPMVTIIGKIASEVGDDPIAASPLWGMTVATTGSESLCTKLAEQLIASGAEPIRCPLIRIEIEDLNDALESALRKIEQYDWVAFSSSNGVRAFFKHLASLNKDCRALSTCRIASVGEQTTRQLLRHGILADVQAEVETGARLAETIVESSTAPGESVLLPRSDRALQTLPAKLGQAGMNVTQVAAYRTVALVPASYLVDQINDSADAILFASPSAVRCAADAGFRYEGKLVVCIGETTADTCQRLGIGVDAVADRASAAGMVEALARAKASSTGVAV